MTSKNKSTNKQSKEDNSSAVAAVLHFTLLDEYLLHVSWLVGVYYLLSGFLCASIAIAVFVPRK